MSRLTTAIARLPLKRRAAIGEAQRHCHTGDDHLDDAAYVSELLRRMADDLVEAVPHGRVGDALHRARHEFLRELHNEGVLTREEAGLRRARWSRG